ncbi:alpha/beta hydrolase [Tsukamurella sp. 8F]|uniref:alpha/beta fold hydrolase n=1 Tax=unclassified Tsukamurella TaxID=2633480 RepID=UPI0023B9AEB4|nr:MULTISPECIES: alpha/beta hydrolase [unclassified Tsukamurella]MDF0528384.1 alpha/beta hydrolase [Tsukamurella sp. 8J]MDF0586209.1 alpha/beta hydrolase [Tsukamurella sp. 8F]
MVVRDVALSAGTIRYRDSGSGPAVVCVHGVFADCAVWRKIESPLVSAGLRVVTPTLPLGAHVLPMAVDADLSPRAVAGLVAEFLDALDLRDVTLVATDTGGAIVQLLLASGRHDRIRGVVLTPCDSFDNFLPRSIRIMQYIARVPGLRVAALQPLRLRPVQRSTYRTLAKHGVPDEVAAAWMRPLLSDRGVQRDMSRFLAAIDHRDTLAAAETLRSFEKPVLLVWPRRAPFFPLKHAHRWVEMLPDARLVDAGDSYTFVSEDEPELLAREITTFTLHRRTVGEAAHDRD